MKRSRLTSFNDAIEGVLWAVRHQTNVRIHLLAAAAALTAAAVLGFSRMEFIIVILVIGFVLASEMINSAVEGCIDLIADHYHPQARIVKDVAAGAVLVSSVVAVAGGFFLFFPHVSDPLLRGVVLVKRAPAYITLVSLIVTVIAVVAAKAWLGKGRPLSGGMPSGHAAVSFAIGTAITLATENPLVACLSLLLALMVAQSRLAYRIHSLGEVVLGALLGSLVTLLMFQLFA